MKESQTEKLRLQVRNFGPIHKANIDLRPLTVFVGPSSTGKSSLATLVYALYQYFGKGLSGLGSYRAIPQPGHSKKMSRLGKVEKLAREQLKLSVQKKPDKKTITLPAVLVNDQVEDEHALRTEICRCYGRTELSSFFRWGDKKNKPHIVLERTYQDSQAYRHEIHLQEHKVKVKASITEDMTLPLDVSEIAYALGGGFLSGAFDEEFDRAFFNLVDRTASRYLLPSLHCSAFYLPDNRIGNMHTHMFVVSSLIAEASMGGTQPTHQMPGMSGVVADFLKHLVQMDSRQVHEKKKKLRHNSVWKDIEATILKGEVNVDTEQSIVHYPHFTYRPHDLPLHDNLPLTAASAMVTQLAPLVLFLKHLVQPGDLMIIEEPEVHLHPDMQVELTRQLATLVNSGVRVLVITHSEWMLEALANIIGRSKAQKSKSKKSNNKPSSAALRQEQVGTWLFDKSKRIKGSIVKEMKLDEDSGLYPSGFDRVAIDLHNDWANISDLVNN